MIAIKFLRTWFFLLPLTGQEFTYDNPNQWILKYPECAGYRQSPIALFSNKAVHANIGPISFQYYDVPIVQTIEATNNGHTVSININSTIEGNTPSISGGGLNAVYEVMGCHFHWGGPPRKPGSEHTINRKRYDLEMHITHKNVKYDTFDTAIANSDGIVVLAILFKGVRVTNNKSYGLNAVYDTLPKLSKSRSRQGINGTITMRSLLANLKPQNFFKYQGSLTTPPCSEAVTWFVFTDILPIELKYLKQFWTLEDSRGVPLLKNYRPLQPVRRQTVYFNKGD